MKSIKPALLDPAKNFTDWETTVESFDSTIEKGNAMEHLVFFLLKTRSNYYGIKEIYMEDEIPSNIRDRIKLETKDNGVDGVYITSDDKITAYQVKFRSGHAVPTAQELSTFWAESEYADVRLIAANCSSLPKVSNKKKNQISILLDTFLGLDEEFFKAFSAYLKDRSISIPKSNYTPRDYQEEIIDNIINGFKNDDRGKLIAACGAGKTLVSMWVHEKMKAHTVLFVVPSLALIKQTLEEWARHASDEFSYICVCSDSSVSLNEEDYINVNSSEVDFPVTTNPEQIINFINSSSSKKIVFCTYNSLDAIANAANDPSVNFDIGIFDESHRTAGTKDSLMFVYGMDDNYIPIKKRLFMTATERLVSPRLKDAVDNSENVIFSMDDKAKYGETFASLNFGEAIERNIICDYKIVTCTITESDIADLVSKHRIITTELGESEAATNIDVVLKQVLIGKVMKELDVRKVISYHSFVKGAKLFVSGSSKILPVGDVIDSIISDTANVSTFTSHINGSMPAGERKAILDTFSKSKRGLISNAKCLTEGVDVPAIDAVYFVDPKNSMVDIVQAVGRALRKSSEKDNDTSFIIVPIVVPDNASLFSHIDPSKFDTLHNVIQALRSQDNRLADIIDKINYSAATGSLGSAKKALGSKVLFMPYSKLGINDFEKSLTLRIAEINKNPSENVKTSIWKESEKNVRKSAMKRVFVSIGDYTMEAYFNSLVLPTLSQFDTPDEDASGNKLKINHNNVSHAVRMGVIRKNGKTYHMTELGKLLLEDSSIQESIAKEQLLKYSCLNKDTGELLFPYRAILKILAAVEYVTRFEFLYCIYSMKSTSDDAIQDTIERIQYLRDTYPNIDILSEANKEKVLSILNTKYDLEFGFKDIWTSRTTTYNQFNYFKKHLWAFDNIFETSEDRSTKEMIRIKPGTQSAIKELLDLTSAIETCATSGDSNEVNELYTKQLYSL